MQSSREAYNENIARIDIILNGKGNPNHDKLGRFATGGSNKSISDKELTEMTRSVWYELPPNASGKPQTPFVAAQQRLLAKIYAKQGYNKKPKLMTSGQFLVEKNGTKVYRGVSDEGLEGNYADAFIKGEKHYPGLGVFGSGTYAADNMDKAKGYVYRFGFIPEKFGINGQVISMIIPKNAKIIEAQEARTKAGLFGDRLYEKTKSIKVTDTKDVGFARWSASLNKDPGIWAAAHGYDAILINGKVSQYKTRAGSSNFQGSNFVILNRGILTVDKYPLTL